MCSDCSQCFSEKEIKKLKNFGWDKKEIDFVENSIVENKIKELIK